MAVKERKWNLFNFMERKMAMSDIVAQKLADQLAFKELALFIGISYIANTLSKCEFKTYENGKEVKNKLYYMLNVSPNPNQNSSQFINKFIEQYYYQGHSLVVPYRTHIHCADSFDVDDSNPLVENKYFNVTFGNQQPKKQYRASEVFYFQLDNRKVKALIDSMYLEYSEIIAQALATFKRTNGSRYKLLLERYQAGDTEFKKLYDSETPLEAVFPDLVKNHPERYKNETLKSHCESMHRYLRENKIMELMHRSFEVIPVPSMLPVEAAALFKRDGYNFICFISRNFILSNFKYN